MNTPTATASGAHTRIQLKRPTLPITIHATISTFDPVSGDFTAWLDTQAQGAAPEAFSLNPNNTYDDSTGLTWEVVR